jgi:uncharacterized membrane protein YdjX (TVP38/TMEM64 family)
VHVVSSEPDPPAPQTVLDPPVVWRRPWARMALVVVVVVGLWVGGTAFGLVDNLTQERVRQMVEASGFWGALVYTAAFVLGQMMHMPGLLFVAAATFAWGGVIGGLIAAVAATIAVAVNFAMVRTVGGGALVEMKRPSIEKLLLNLHRRPMLTMIAARVFFLTSPLLSTMLALSGVRFRDHAIASGLGMLGPILVWAIIFEAALN